MPDPERPIESVLEYAAFIAAVIDRAQPAGKPLISVPEHLEPGSIALQALEQRRARTRRDPRPRKKIARNPQNNSNPGSPAAAQTGSRFTEGPN